jgi:hypothetical protein
VCVPKTPATQNILRQDGCRYLRSDCESLNRTYGRPAISEGLLADRWVEHIHREAENLLPLPFAGGFLGPDLLP